MLILFSMQEHCNEATANDLAACLLNCQQQEPKYVYPQMERQIETCIFRLKKNTASVEPLVGWGTTIQTGWVILHFFWRSSPRWLGRPQTQCSISQGSQIPTNVQDKDLSDNSESESILVSAFCPGLESSHWTDSPIIYFRTPSLWWSGTSPLSEMCSVYGKSQNVVGNSNDTEGPTTGSLFSGLPLILHSQSALMRLSSSSGKRVTPNCHTQKSVTDLY